MEIAAWLKAQAEADKAAAGAATPGPWEFDDGDTDGEVFETEDCHPVAYCRSGGDWRHPDAISRTDANGRHVALHDPRTEAARAESVLLVIGEYEVAALTFEASREKPGGVPESIYGLVRGLGRVVRLLAWGYRHREGYQQGWAPAARTAAASARERKP
jgi:hypothetical protein